MSQAWQSDGDQGQQGTGAGQGVRGGSAAGSWPDVPKPQTGLPNSVQSQLTPQEAEAIRLVKRSSDKARYAGYFLGGTLTYLLLQRRKPSPPGLVGQASMTILGAFAGGIVLMPFGMLTGTKHLRNVEDPKHLASVMQSAIDQRRGRPPLPITSGPGAGVGVGTGAGAGAGAGAMGAQQFFSADVGQGQASPYPSPPPYPSSERDSSPSSSGAFDYDNAPPLEQQGASQQQQQQQQTSSRWAQLRGERGVQASAWDRIRQEKARESMAQRNGSSGVGSSYDMGAEGPGARAEGGRESRYGSPGNLADPTFGKGTSNNRDQARQEFEASFEREKRGLDG